MTGLPAREFLRTLFDAAVAAADPARVHLSPGTAELTDIYLEIARVIPCPATLYWGQR